MHDLLLLPGGPVQLVEPKASDPAVALGVVDGVRMAMNGRKRAERRRGTAMVGVGVAEDDAADATERFGRGGDRKRHALLAGVEDHDRAAVLDEIDVHRPPDAAADQRDAGRDPLGLRGGEAEEARPSANRTTRPGRGSLRGRGFQRGGGHFTRLVPPLVLRKTA